MEVAIAQSTDEELQWAKEQSSLKLIPEPIKGSRHPLWKNVSSGNPRIYLPAGLRPSVFRYVFVQEEDADGIQTPRYQARTLCFAELRNQ
ncbi:hypothetical protein TTRE_0000915701 [Trichuris trichiura]|uniref:Uncharacterized protein n=1 Tax=Trichuris trichiura TaxID=36087 RepID=A0A077ZM12_TRITR|nr:hypothetical protein TTRE_0000915701 [Trichuris trichiura]